jgi:hypothetical protein
MDKCATEKIKNKYSNSQWQTTTNYSAVQLTMQIFLSTLSIILLSSIIIYHCKNYINNSIFILYKYKKLQHFYLTFFSTFFSFNISLLLQSYFDKIIQKHKSSSIAKYNNNKSLLCSTTNNNLYFYIILSTYNYNN